MADRDEKDWEKVAQRVEAAHGYLHIDERAAELAKSVGCTLDRGEGENQLAAFAQRELEQYLARWALPGPACIERVGFPWHRFFEIDLSLKSAR